MNGRRTALQRVANIPRLSDFEGLLKGRPAAILGGGPSLVDDLKRIPDNAIRFGINHHAGRIAPCDFTVFYDRENHQNIIDNVLPSRIGRLIAPFADLTDIFINRCGWFAGLTSAQAAWIAYFMGCSPVILCGMDCYGRGGRYFYSVEGRGLPQDVKHPKDLVPLDDHLNAWRGCPDDAAEHIVAASGPLVDVFGKWGRDVFI